MKKLTRSGIDFSEITREISDTEMLKSLENLLQKYPDVIHYELWEPRNTEGLVVYGQNECILKHFEKFGDQCDWTAYLDVDEFIYCCVNIKEVFTACEINNIGRINLLQKKFDDRYNNLNRPVTGIVNCIGDLDTNGWAPKCIVRNAFFDILPPHLWTIHDIPVKNCFHLWANEQTLRFNHYNVNEALFDWMKSYYKTDKYFACNDICDNISKHFNYECRIILESTANIRY